MSDEPYARKAGQRAVSTGESKVRVGVYIIYI